MELQWNYDEIAMELQRNCDGFGTAIESACETMSVGTKRDLLPRLWAPLRGPPAASAPVRVWSV
jgi:hypothetical protein